MNRTARMQSSLEPWDKVRATGPHSTRVKAAKHRSLPTVGVSGLNGLASLGTRVTETEEGGWGLVRFACPESQPQETDDMEFRNPLACN